MMMVTREPKPQTNGEYELTDDVLRYRYLKDMVINARSVVEREQIDKAEKEFADTLGKVNPIAVTASGVPYCDTRYEDIGRAEKAAHGLTELQERATLYGAIDSDSRKTFRSIVGVSTIGLDSLYPLEQASFAYVRESVVMDLLPNVSAWNDEDQGDTKAVLDAATRLGARAGVIAHLKDAGERVTGVRMNQGYGSNFLYRYSAPYIRIGLNSDDKLVAQLGWCQVHRNNGYGGDGMKFEGSIVDTELAIQMVEENIKSFHDQAEDGKAACDFTETPTSRLESEKAKIEQSIPEYIEYMRDVAPELDILTDSQLESIIARVNIPSIFYQLPSAERYAMDVMCSPRHAPSECDCDADGKLLGYRKSPYGQKAYYLAINGSDVTISEYACKRGFPYQSLDIPPLSVRQLEVTPDELAILRTDLRDKYIENFEK